MDFKKLLLTISVGRLKGSPFSIEVVEEIRDSLPMILKESGHGDGLPGAGGDVPMFKVRLIQGLLSAFGDPDSYFCTFWVRGVCLGSPAWK